VHLGLDDAVARELVALPNVVWHQKFFLSDEVATPGTNEIEWLCSLAGAPDDLSGMSVLDVGTTNGGAAFLAERRGADRVVAVDIYPPDRFAFENIARALDSKVQFVQASIYELPEVVDEKFDLIYFYGVLYHLRHPLLAVDQLRRLAKGTVAVETAICPPSEGPVVTEFYAGEYRGDPTNWFVPSLECLRGMLESSGFVVDGTESWPRSEPTRGLACCRVVDEAEYEETGYEVPLRVVVGGELPERGSYRS
jgi:tRNA (mo5U34)-methyltransferase